MTDTAEDRALAAEAARRVDRSIEESKQHACRLINRS